MAEVPDVFRALTDLYASVDADVVCLQEVHRAGLAESLAGALGLPAWFHAPGGLRPDYGGVVMTRPAARLRDCTRPAGHPPHERVHLRASLETEGGPLEIAAVHLPSNRFAGSAEAGHAARIAELTRILAEPVRPNLVLGDMNCKPDSPPYRFMRDAGYADAAVLAGNGSAPTYRFAVNPTSVTKSRVDYIWLDASLAKRMVSFASLDNGPFCRTAPDGAAWHLSDHSPLLIELR